LFPFRHRLPMDTSYPRVVCAVGIPPIGIETAATAPRASFVVASNRRAGVGHELVRRRDSQPLRASGAGFVLSTGAGVAGALESSVPQMALAGINAGPNRVLV